MKIYLDNLKKVLEEGYDQIDRTGVGTRSMFGVQMRFDLSKGFPAITTKKLAWKSVVSELLWFLEGSHDERRLCEILHGTRDPSKKTIWTDNANSEYWLKKSPEFAGDLGRIYGVQWRSWDYNIDQISNLINGIKTDPHSRRHIVSAWNPSDLDSMALPPCHVMSQFNVSNGKLNCQMYQRSGDAFLGIPFNIASYSLLTHMIAQVCSLEVGEFIHVIGDFHIYNDHIGQVKEQLKRVPFDCPRLILNPKIKNIFDFNMGDIELENYLCHPPISAKMAV